MDAIETISVGRVLEVRVTGKLTKESYQKFVPAVDAQIKQHGKLRILFVMQDFHGWTVGAMWEDLKFDLKHWKDIDAWPLSATRNGKKAWRRSASLSPRPRFATSTRLKSTQLANGSRARPSSRSNPKFDRSANFGRCDPQTEFLERAASATFGACLFSNCPQKAGQQVIGRTGVFATARNGESNTQARATRISRRREMITRASGRSLSVC